MRIFSLSAFSTLLIVASLAVVACKPEAADTKDEQTCISDFFPKYVETNLEQCMAVCKKCRHGSTATCSTSCQLKGAS
jgi:hypothetical protein